MSEQASTRRRAIRPGRIPLLLALLTSFATAPPAQSAEVLFTAFGQTGTIRTVGPTDDPTRSALKEVVAKIQKIDLMTHSGDTARSASVAQLNRDAAGEPMPVDPALLDLLERAVGFCLWSDGLISPLGGAFYELWDQYIGTDRGPPTTALTEALETAACDRITLDREASTVTLRDGSLIDLRNFAIGSAIDQAVDSLRDHGFETASVRIGNIERSFGPGPSGSGWLVHLPADLGFELPMTPVYLIDRAIAMSNRSAPAEQIGHRFDLRNGRAPTGVWAVVASTDLATDAQGLAAAMFILGSREGEMRLGALRPSPSVLWLLGTGVGRPVLNSYRWSLVSSN